MKLHSEAHERDTGRIDLWLKLVCLFKHRSEAADACRGGLVKVNGSRIKPAQKVKPGDVIEITGDHYRKVVVLELPAGNVSKQIARTLYRDETPELPKKDVLDIVFGERERGAGRPTKRERRDIEKWERGK